MSLIIQKVGDDYIADVKHEYQKIFWKSEKPMPKDKLISKLLELGCHQQDIGDAFYEADPNWLEEKNSH